MRAGFRGAQRAPGRASPGISSLVWRCTAAVLVLSAFAPSANAYVGPVMGIGAIAAALGTAGLLLSILLTALWYPFKHMLRRRRTKAASSGEPGDDAGAEDDAER